MLRDDAIRAGLIKPTEEDRKRMNLPGDYTVKSKEQEEESNIDLKNLTYLQLKQTADDLGITLPKKYINKESLIELIENKLK